MASPAAGPDRLDISAPDKPRKTGQLDVDGAGFPRLWYVGGRYAYASALLDGFTGCIFVTIGMASTARPELAGRRWLPGMNKAEGEVPQATDGHAHCKKPIAIYNRSIAPEPVAPIEGKDVGMAKLVFGMNQSLDGYVDHMAFAPGPTLFRHFVEEAERQAGSVYGRQMYEIMSYWDDDHPGWSAAEQAFAAAWRNQPKWVVSRSLTSVGPNAGLVDGNLEGAIRTLKAERDGEIEVAGPGLAQSLTELGLIDEYRIYLHPVVLGHGKPYFAGPRPRLRLMAHDRIGEDVIRLTYIPA